MYFIFSTMLVMLSLTFLTFFQAQENTKDKSDFPVLTGPYLGQKPPEMKPEVFAPGIVSVKKYREYVRVFTSDGRECVFDRYGDDEFQDGAVFTTKLEKGNWIKPEIHELFVKYDNVFLPTVSPDGNYLIFDSDDRPRDGECRLHISFMKSDNLWTKPISMGKYIKQKAAIAWVSYDGKYIFFKAEGDIYWVDAKIIEKLKPNENKRRNKP